LNAAVATQAQLQTEQQRQQAEALQSTAKRELDAVLEKVPEWRDAAKREAANRELLAYAQQQGLTAEEFNGIIDHRAILTLRKAMLYDRAQAAKAQATTKPVPPVTKPGTRNVDRTAEAREAALKRLNSTGDIMDGLAFLRASRG
jgi:hypothetical protein